MCQKCGSQRLRWEGRCQECGAWNSFVEEVQSDSLSNFSRISDLNLLEHEKNEIRGSTKRASFLPSRLKLDSKSLENESHFVRHRTGFFELDRVLGGGLVPGSYTLLGGDPGVGKSTLLLQISGFLASQEKRKVLYISGEESASQTALRAKRLKVKSSLIEVVAESSLESILKIVKSSSPHVVIIDSIQTLFLSKLSSAPGSILQVRECAGRLMEVAKRMNISIFLIGHVTKDGNLAGPKVLEHMVDTVLSFEGDSNYTFRLLRSLKNRFGPANELGVFQMNFDGLKDVKNPSELFLEERNPFSTGSAVFSAMEGNRPLLCEIQALPIFNSNPVSMPRRTTTGFDIHRLHMLNAVLDKQIRLNLASSDVFINVVGGLKIGEPAADIAAASALISSSKNLKINTKACFFGELGLTGEVRGVSFAVERLKEAEKLGFQYFILPFSNKKHLLLKKKSGEESSKNLHYFWIKHVKELPEFLKETL